MQSFQHLMLLTTVWVDILQLTPWSLSTQLLPLLVPGLDGPNMITHKLTPPMTQIPSQLDHGELPPTTQEMQESSSILFMKLTPPSSNHKFNTRKMKTILIIAPRAPMTLRKLLIIKLLMMKLPDKKISSKLPSSQKLLSQLDQTHQLNHTLIRDHPSNAQLIQRQQWKQQPLNKDWLEP